MSATQRKNPRILKRNTLIRKKFKELTEDKHFNTEHALKLLEEAFITLKPETIWLIVSQTGHYKNY